MPTQTYFPTEMADYANLVGEINFWNGVLHEASIRKDEHMIEASAKNIRRGIQKYKERVPQAIRNLTHINLSELEAQCSRILG